MIYKQKSNEYFTVLENGNTCRGQRYSEVKLSRCDYIFVYRKKNA